MASQADHFMDISWKFQSNAPSGIAAVARAGNQAMGVLDKASNSFDRYGNTIKSTYGTATKVAGLFSKDFSRAGNILDKQNMRSSLGFLVVKKTLDKQYGPSVEKVIKGYEKYVKWSTKIEHGLDKMTTLFKKLQDRLSRGVSQVVDTLQNKFHDFSDAITKANGVAESFQFGDQMIGLQKNIQLTTAELEMLGIAAGDVSTTVGKSREELLGTIGDLYKMGFRAEKQYKALAKAATQFNIALAIPEQDSIQLFATLRRSIKGTEQDYIDVGRALGMVSKAGGTSVQEMIQQVQEAQLYFTHLPEGVDKAAIGSLAAIASASKEILNDTGGTATKFLTTIVDGTSEAAVNAGKLTGLIARSGSAINMQLTLQKIRSGEVAEGMNDLATAVRAVSERGGVRSLHQMADAMGIDVTYLSQLSNHSVEFTKRLAEMNKVVQNNISSNASFQTELDKQNKTIERLNETIDSTAQTIKGKFTDTLVSITRPALITVGNAVQYVLDKINGLVGPLSKTQTILSVVFGGWILGKITKFISHITLAKVGVGLLNKALLLASKFEFTNSLANWAVYNVSKVKLLENAFRGIAHSGSVTGHALELVGEEAVSVGKSLKYLAAEGAFGELGAKMLGLSKHGTLLDRLFGRITAFAAKPILGEWFTKQAHASTKFGKAIFWIAEKIGSLFGFLKTKLGSLFGAFGKGGGVVEFFKSIVKWVVKSSAEFTWFGKSILRFGGAMKWLGGKIFSFLTNPIVGAILIVNDLLNLFDSLPIKTQKSILSGVEYIGTFFSSMGNMFNKTIDYVFDLIDDGFSAVGNFIGNIPDMIGDYISSGGNTTGPRLSGLLLESVGHALSGVFKFVSDIFVGIGKIIVRGLWSGLKGILKLGWGIIKMLWSAITKPIAWLSKTFFDWLFGVKSKSNWESSFNGLKDWLIDAFLGLGTILASPFTGIANSFMENVYNPMMSAVGNLVVYIASAFQVAWSNIKDFGAKTKYAIGQIPVIGRGLQTLGIADTDAAAKAKVAAHAKELKEIQSAMRANLAAIAVDFKGVQVANTKAGAINDQVDAQNKLNAAKKGEMSLDQKKIALMQSWKGTNINMTQLRAYGMTLNKGGNDLSQLPKLESRKNVAKFGMQNVEPTRPRNFGSLGSVAQTVQSATPPIAATTEKHDTAPIQRRGKYGRLVTNTARFVEPPQKAATYEWLSQFAPEAWSNKNKENYSKEKMFIKGQQDLVGQQKVLKTDSDLEKFVQYLPVLYKIASSLEAIEETTKASLEGQEKANQNLAATGVNAVAKMLGLARGAKTAPSMNHRIPSGLTVLGGGGV